MNWQANVTWSQPRLAGMPAGPQPRQRRPRPVRIAWTLPKRGRRPVCLRCSEEAYAAGRLGPVAIGIYQRKGPDGTSWFCPPHAEDQRRADKAAPLPPLRGELR